jgi:monooxygenase
MLQRSPSYVLSRPGVDKVARGLRRVLPEGLAYALSRWKNVALGSLLYQLARRRPAKMREFLLSQVKRALGPDHAVDPNFTPSYDPWDQRLCLVPDNDLFKAIRSGKADVVTDTIETFTETGCASAPGASCQPTSSSPRPGSSCCSSAAASSWSTARRSSWRRGSASRASC